MKIELKIVSAFVTVSDLDRVPTGVAPGSILLEGSFWEVNVPTVGSKPIGRFQVEVSATNVLIFSPVAPEQTLPPEYAKHDEIISRMIRHFVAGMKYCNAYVWV